MKKLLVIMLAGCVLAMSHGVRHVAAEEDSSHTFDTGGKIPPSHLGGTYATTAHGSEFLCFKDTPPFPLAKCGSPGTFGAALSLLTAGSVTQDLKSNCATFTAVLSDLPVDVSPPGVF